MEVKFIPLSFINEPEKIRDQIRNTIIFQFVFKKYENLLPLGDLLSNTRYGYTASASEEGKFKLVRITDIQHGRIDWNRVPFCECENPKEYLLEEGDILVARTGGTVGKTFLIEEKAKDAVFASYLIRLRSNDKKVLPKYVFYFLNSYSYWSQISDLKSGSAQPNVNAEKLKEILIPYCDLNLQKKIIELIESGKSGDLGDLKDSLKKAFSNFENINNLKNLNSDLPKFVSSLRKQILQEAVQGKVVKQDPKDEPASALLKKIKAEKEKLIKEGKIRKEKPLAPISEDEIPYELPKGWEWARFGEIAQHNSGKTLDKGRNKGELRKYITTSNLYWGYFELDNLRQMPIEKKEMEKCSATKGDLLIIEGGEAGRASVWEEDYDVCFQNHIHRARFFGGISPYYLFRFFEKINLTGEINNYRKGVAISNMSGKSLSSIMVPLPPLSEQKRIVEKVSQLMDYCDLLERQIKENQGNSEKLMEAVLKESFKNK